MSDSPIFAPGEFSGVGDAPPSALDVDPLGLPAGSEAPRFWNRSEPWRAVALFGGLLVLEATLPWLTGGGVFYAYLFFAILVLFGQGVASVAGWPALSVACGANGATAFLLLGWLALAQPAPSTTSLVTVGLALGGTGLLLGGLIRSFRLAQIEDR